MRVLVLAILVACNPGNPATGEARLIAHYPMDEIGGGVARDDSGENHHGMCTTCPLVVRGKIDNGYSFDGGDQQIDIPPAPAFSTDGALSVTAWVSLEMAPAQLPGCLAVHGSAWRLCITQDLLPAFGSVTGTSALTLNAFHHVAIIWDGTNKRIALDGVEVFSQPGTVAADPDGIALGAELIGVVDDVRIYDGAVTDDQLAMIAAP